MIEKNCLLDSRTRIDSYKHDVENCRVFGVYVGEFRLYCNDLCFFIRCCCRRRRSRRCRCLNSLLLFCCLRKLDLANSRTQRLDWKLELATGYRRVRRVNTKQHRSRVISIQYDYCPMMIKWYCVCYHTLLRLTHTHSIYARTMQFFVVVTCAAAAADCSRARPIAFNMINFLN